MFVPSMVQLARTCGLPPLPGCSVVTCWPATDTATVNIRTRAATNAGLFIEISSSSSLLVRLWRRYFSFRSRGSGRPLQLGITKASLSTSPEELQLQREMDDLRWTGRYRACFCGAGALGYTALIRTIDEVQVFGTHAFDRGSFWFTVAPKSGGKTSRATGKYLFSYSRATDGAWKLARLIV